MHRCTVCRKTFPTPSKLRRHQLIHTGQKPFICKICGKAFSQTVHLKTHLLSVHDSHITGGSQLRGSLSNDQEPNCKKTAAGIGTLGNHGILPSTAFSTVFSQPKWKRGTETQKPCLPLYETGYGRTSMEHVINGSVTQSSISCHMDPVRQDQVDSANVDKSICSIRKRFTCKICLKSFSSSLQLWIHSPIHSKSKSIERKEASSVKINLKRCLQPQDLTSSFESRTAQKHQCCKCLKTFCSPSKLQRHFLTHTGQKPYTCTVCQKRFTQKVHLKSHLAIKCLDHKTSNLQTQLSLQGPSSHLSSSMEFKLQHKISVNTVNDLNKTKINLDAFEELEQTLITGSMGQNVCKSVEPELTKTDMKPFQCMSCNKSFRLEVNFINHCKIHHNSKELGHSNDMKISDSVEKRHVPKCSPADHTDSHTVTVEPESWRELWDDSSSLDALSTKWQKEPCVPTNNQRVNTAHQCYWCSKRFPSASKLQRHVMTHTGQRPFHCEICGKRFRQKTHLRVHSRTHLWARYWKQRSLYISRPPSRASGLNMRAAADIPNKKIIVPKKEIGTGAAKDITSAGHLLRITQNNGERQSRSKMLPHILNKNETLHFTKVSKVNLKSTQNPGSVPHKCFHCFKCFQSASKLQRHVLVHTGLRPFQCPKCTRAFRQSSHLKTHESTCCNRKLSKPVNQQVNIGQLKTSQQQQFYPRIAVGVQTQQQSANTSAMSSVFDSAVSKRGNELVCTRPAEKTNMKSKAKKMHACRICCKNFPSPYKLSRHLVTHSGLRPFKCALCNRTFTQSCHLKVHELRCRQENRTSHSVYKVIKKYQPPPE